MLLVTCHMLLLLSSETCYSTLPYTLLHMLLVFVRISYWKWNMLPRYCYISKNTLYIIFKIKFAVTCQKFKNSTKFTLILIVFDSNVLSNVCSNVSDNVTVCVYLFVSQFAMISAFQWHCSLSFSQSIFHHCNISIMLLFSFIWTGEGQNAPPPGFC